MALQLRISGLHHEVLIQHLLPKDGREAVALALCGRYYRGPEKILMIHDLTLIPHNECYSRERDFYVGLLKELCLTSNEFHKVI